MTAVAPARDRLLEAARVVLAREGLAGLTLRAIAREAGVSHGAPLRHFPGLAALLAALATQGFHGLVGEVQRHVDEAPPDEDARQRLARAGAGYVAFATGDPGVFGVMFRPEVCDTSDAAYQEAGAASFDQLVQLVAAAQAEGWRAGHPPDQLAAVLWANMHGLAQLWLHGALQAVVADLVGPGQLLDLSTDLTFGEP